MKKMDFPGAWYITKGSNRVKIAILDTGIKSKHEDLRGKVVASENFTADRNKKTVEDRNGHGTHIAGIVAANTDNGYGISGSGFDCSLMSLKVLDDNGNGAWSWIAEGVIWAADNGANVINMSFGGDLNSQTVLEAVNYAWENGVVLVAAAGNDGEGTKFYPASYDKIIAVAATDKDDNLASFSNFGTWVDVAAPGVDILSTYSKYNSPYTLMSGTSTAAAHVAGLAGLLASQGRNNGSIRAAIEKTTDKKGSYPLANGRISAHNAVDFTRK
jgi:thermitase